MGPGCMVQWGWVCSVWDWDVRCSGVKLCSAVGPGCTVHGAGVRCMGPGNAVRWSQGAWCSGAGSKSQEVMTQNHRSQGGVAFVFFPCCQDKVPICRVVLRALGVWFTGALSPSLLVLVLYAKTTAGALGSPFPEYLCMCDSFCRQDSPSYDFPSHFWWFGLILSIGSSRKPFCAY